MKKIIALALSFVMTLALFTVGTNAVVFSDGATITPDYKDAVEIMASLGVLKGNEDRSFAPRNTLTRAEAAKIISYVLLGAESADKLTCDTPVFDDVAANFWGAPYIAFCVAQGIINGNGDGTFTPDGKLTGFAFAKMLLGAINFGGNYTGPSWEVSVLEDVKKTEKNSYDAKGLLEVIEDINLGEEITREKASQMAFNALFYKSKDATEYAIQINNGNVALEEAVKNKTFPTMKELTAFLKSCGVDVADNRKNVVYSVIDSTETLAEKNFEIKTLDGYVVRNSFVSLDEFTTVRDDAGMEHKFNMITTESLFGHRVTVYYKDEWAWEKGDDNETKGTTYSMLDHTKPVKISSKNGVSEEELENLLCVKKIDTTDVIEHYHQLYEYDKQASGTFYDTKVNVAFSSFFKQNGKDPTKWDIEESGTLLLLEKEDKKGEYTIDGFFKDGSYPIKYNVDLLDEENEYYTVTIDRTGEVIVKMDDPDPDECYDRSIADSQGNAVAWLDYINYEDGDPQYNTPTSGQVTLFTLQKGELYAAGNGLTKVTGKIEKIQLRETTESGRSSMTIGGKKYSLPDSMSRSDSYEELTNKGKQAHYILDSIRAYNLFLNQDLQDDLDAGLDKEYTFFVRSNVIYAYAEVANDSKLIFPTKLYCIDTVDQNDEYDDYGKKIDDEDRYEYYVQGVDLDGEEVKLPVKWDYDGSKLGNSAGAFLKVGSGKGYTEEGVPASDYTVAFVENKDAFRTNSNGTYLPHLYSYTMETEGGETYAHFTLRIDADNRLYEDPDGEFAVEVFNGLSVTKDTKRIIQDNTYLMSSGYAVISLNDENGKDLRVSKLENAYKQIGPYTVLYGEKDSADDTDHYTLKAAFNMKETLTVAGDKLIFVSSDFTNENKTSVTYTDKNGREKTVTAYEQYVYVDGEGDWILTAENSGCYAGGLYEYEIDEYSGLYKNFTRYAGNDWYTGIVGLQEDYSLVSFGSVSALQDCDVSGATVINTTDYTIKNSLAVLAADEHHLYRLAVKLNDDDEVETVYVYNVAVACDITFDGEVVADDDVFALAVGEDAVFSCKDKTSAQGVKAVAKCGGASFNPVIDSGKKTITFAGLANGTYEVTVTLSEANCAAQVLHFTLQVGGPV